MKFILLLRKRSLPLKTLSLIMEKQQPKAHLQTESYAIQCEKWPQQGRHIMAQYDEQSIVVYQAYNPPIAKAIVESQNFHSEKCKKVGYNMNRMTWIKPNFLWMMYRSGWATKKNQERILAIRLKRQGFERILSKAILSKFDEEKNQKPGKDDPVRLQWDPDHLPNGQKHKLRKAIQLGLRGQMLEKMSKEFIVNIEDITELVEQNRDLINDAEQLQVPKQATYPIDNEQLAKNVGITMLG